MDKCKKEKNLRSRCSILVACLCVKSWGGWELKGEDVLFKESDSPEEIIVQKICQL